MQTGKCAKVTRAVALGQILISYFHTLNTDERSPTEFPLCQSQMPDSLTIREQRILMEQVSLCIYYMLIAVSCLHCPDAIYQHDFSVNHICEQHMRIIIHLRSLVSPLLFAVERPLPFINCFWSVLVLTDPDQLGVTGFV